MNRRAMTKLYSALRPVIAIALSGMLLACDAPAPPQIAGTDIAGTPIGGAFTLTDKDGKVVTADQFKGKYRIDLFRLHLLPRCLPG